MEQRREREPLRQRRYLDEEPYGRDTDPERSDRYGVERAAAPRDRGDRLDPPDPRLERSERQSQSRRYARDEGPLDVEPLDPRDSRGASRDISRDISRDPW